MSSNTFCRHLSNGYRFFIQDNKITWLPCCYWDGPTFQFEDLILVRKQINDSTPWAHKECNKCKVEEEYKEEGCLRKIGESVIPPNLPDTKTAWLELQIDSICNGGCLICHPALSTFWQSEVARANEYIPIKSKINIKDTVDTILKQLDVSDLRLLHVLGGEPFLSDVDQFVIPYVTSPELCELRYTTNGSIYPQQERLDSWKSFKSVTLNLSIDDIGPRFEYLRYPLSWSKVESNIKRLIDETDDHVMFQINHTVTPFNIYYHQEFLDWVDKVIPSNRFGKMHVHPAYGIMSVKYCNDQLRDLVRSKYRSDHLLNKMLDENPTTSNREFWSYIRKWDQQRNQNWRTVFPELVGIFNF